MIDAKDLIRRLQLEPLPVEGGYFRQTWQSDDRVSAARYSSSHTGGSAIYYLLSDEPDSFSALHRLATDEIYHFYLGDPVEMLLLAENGPGERIVLGPDLAGGQHVQYVVSRYVWQGSRVIPGGRFTLLGATMAPGYDPADFSLGDRHELLRQFPAQAALIRALTR